MTKTHAATTARARPDGAKPAAVNGKITDLTDLTRRLAAMRNGKRVVHCHGVFDLLHIGHIRHLAQARRLGDILVVTVTPDRYVNKGPGRPAFGEKLRAEALAALDCVDFVAVNKWSKATETIRQLRPNVYVKGGEYRDGERDRTNGITAEADAVRDVGGELVFTNDLTFSSSHLINHHLLDLPDSVRQYLRRYAITHGSDQTIEYLDRAQSLRMLVVGDAIIDEYQYCESIGKSSKEPIIAVKRLSTERFAGGILAVANHAAGFCDNVRLMTVLGETERRERFIRKSLRSNVEPTFFTRPDAPTIVKRRYIDRYFFQKLFAVYELDDTPLSGDAHDAFCDALTDEIGEFDVVLVVDFGHGTITQRMIELLCDKAPFLAVNAQSNAGNVGYHTISRYRRADFVCIAENEMRLEARDRHGELRPMLIDVSRQLCCPRVVVTRGAQGCLCYEAEQGLVDVPAVAGKVTDRMGAGDTFMSVAALCAAQGAPMEVVGFVGNAAGAQAVATVGHRESLQRVPFIRHIECLLK